MNSKKLKELRKKMKKTQQDMANILEISQPTYATYENATREPPNDMILKIAQFFNVSTDFLLDNDKKSINTNTKENHITIIGRGGLIKEYDLPPENVAALETILENLKNKED